MQRRLKRDQEERETSFRPEGEFFERDVAGRIPTDRRQLSPLGLNLLDKWSWGKLSAPGLQEIAQAAVQSGCSKPDVMFMASLGSHGAYQNNVQRDLMRTYCSHLSTPEPLGFKVPLKLRKPDGSTAVELSDFSVACPHDWLCSLDRHDRLDSIWGANKIEEFWASQLPGDPKLFDNPMTSVPHWERLFLPMLLHGDAAAFTSAGSLLQQSFRTDKRIKRSINFVSNLKMHPSQEHLV